MHTRMIHISYGCLAMLWPRFCVWGYWWAARGGPCAVGVQAVLTGAGMPGVKHAVWFTETSYACVHIYLAGAGEHVW